MSPLRRRRASIRAARLGAGPARQLAIFLTGALVGAVGVAVGVEATRSMSPSGAGLETPTAAASTATARSADLARPTASPIATAASASVATARRSAEPANMAPSAPSGAPQVDVGAALLARAARTSPQKGFGLQLGAYETEAEVAQVLGRHAAALEGLELWVLPVELDGKGTWHRLRVGKLATRRDAEALRARLPEDVAAVAIVVNHR